jgi:hypothetical protein
MSRSPKNTLLARGAPGSPRRFDDGPLVQVAVELLVHDTNLSARQAFERACEYIPGWEAFDEAVKAQTRARVKKLFRSTGKAQIEARRGKWPPGPALPTLISPIQAPQQVATHDAGRELVQGLRDVAEWGLRLRDWRNSKPVKVRSIRI